MMIISCIWGLLLKAIHVRHTFATVFDPGVAVRPGLLHSASCYCHSQCLAQANSFSINTPRQVHRTHWKPWHMPPSSHYISTTGRPSADEAYTAACYSHPASYIHGQARSSRRDWLAPALPIPCSQVLRTGPHAWNPLAGARAPLAAWEPQGPEGDAQEAPSSRRDDECEPDARLPCGCQQGHRPNCSGPLCAPSSSVLLFPSRDAGRDHAAQKSRNALW